MANQYSPQINHIINRLIQLREPQLILVERIVKQLSQPYVVIERLETSDIIDECTLYSFGDYLRIHHSVSNGPMEKKRFEYAFEAALKSCGHNTFLAEMGNPGEDITIDGAKFSLKTQADKNIKVNEIHVSKWMELGKGQWSSSEQDLYGLRDQFFNHIRNYDRVIILRCLQKGRPHWKYELVEIPKCLLNEAINGKIKMMHNSTQNPKPGYCTITDNNNNIRFQLYFDGGGERKLQVRKIRKDLCHVQAIWQFDSLDIS